MQTKDGTVSLEKMQDFVRRASRAAPKRSLGTCRVRSAGATRQGATDFRTDLLV